MADHPQISKGSLKMLQEEACNAVRDENEDLPPETVDKIYTAVEHAFDHALEEGIVILPEPQLTEREHRILAWDKSPEEWEDEHGGQYGAELVDAEKKTLRNIRRSTELGRMHDDIAQEQAIERIASELALIDEYDRNLEPDWDAAKMRYENQAKRIIQALNS